MRRTTCRAGPGVECARGRHRIVNTGNRGGDGSKTIDFGLLDERLKAVVSTLPFPWMISYSGEGAHQNIRFFENGARHRLVTLPIRVFMSTQTAAVVISFVPIEAVKEPHVREWLSTFYEVPVEEAKTRLENFPDWPYDGREPREASNARAGQ